MRLIGQAIRDGSTYLPIRNHAAGLATRAAPKDYLGQARAVYDDFTKKRWRYVKDPVENELVHITGPAIWGQIAGANARPGERGHEDCDGATVYLGSALYGLGFPVVVNTISPPGSNKLFTHVFPSAKIPKVGWIAFDAVGYPEHPLGWIAPHSRIATWDLDGNLIDARGNFPPEFRQMESAGLGANDEGGIAMQTDWQDYGLQNYGLAGIDSEEPLDFAVHGLKGFGAYAATMGIIDGDACGLMAEYDASDFIQTPHGPLVERKMLEMSPEDVRHVAMYGRPRPRAVALADDGDVYQWQPAGDLGAGFFKKIFKGVKKAAKWIGGKAKKLVKKLPGGKYIVKLHEKIHKVAKGLVKPLVKFVGKYAKPLAKIAALIPGYGPAIAGALYTAGKISDVLRETGVKVDKSGTPKFKDKKQAAHFKKVLEREAEKMKKHGPPRTPKQLPGRPRRPAPAWRAAKIAARRFPKGMLPQQFDPRWLRAGTPAHTAALRSLGADIPEGADFPREASYVLR